jgi:hypothetical protein
MAEENNDESDLERGTKRAFEEQVNILLRTFPWGEIAALNNAGLCSLTDISVTFSIHEGDFRRGELRSSGATWEDVLRASCERKAREDKGQKATMTFVRELWKLRSAFMKQLLPATDSNAKYLKEYADWFFRVSSGVGPKSSIMALVHCVEIINFLREAVEEGFQEHWEKIAAARDLLIEPSANEQRGLFVEEVDVALRTFHERLQGSVESSQVEEAFHYAADILLESIMDQPMLHEFLVLKEDDLWEPFIRALPDAPKAIKAPYLAALLSLKAGAFNDKIMPGEDEDTACRRISNNFRNALNAGRRARKK